MNAFTEPHDLEATVRVRTVWISDLHLGTPGCQAAALLEFLRTVDCETLYLVGDIIDGWQLRRTWYWPQAHNDVLQKILRKARKGTRVVFVPGNHDEFARRYVEHVFGGVEVVEVMRNLPFATRTTQDLLESKVLVMTLVFVYAFMRFTWSLRQFNLVNIMVGAFPAHRDRLVQDDRLVQTASRLNELAGVNFAQGLRAYYYAVPLLLWLVHPWLLAVGTVAITLAVYYMEFRSATVRALAADAGGSGGS